MVKILLKALVVVFFFILLSSGAYAISLGSVAKNKFDEISNDESTKFTMLFWNIENESYTVKLSVKESPKDWVVIIDPIEFILNKSVGEEYVSLPYLNENIRAKVVNVFVKPDIKSETGKYFIVIKAETELPRLEINGMNMIPERLFQFEINLKSFTNSNDNVDKKLEFHENSVDVKNEKIEMKNLTIENKLNKEYFYFIAVFLIITISIIIYKKS